MAFLACLPDRLYKCLHISPRSELNVPAAGAKKRVHLQAKAGAGHFIVDPDQVIRMTMLILWKMIMLLKKICY